MPETTSGIISNEARLPKSINHTQSYHWGNCLHQKKQRIAHGMVVNEHEDCSLH